MMIRTKMTKALLALTAFALPLGLAAQHAGHQAEGHEGMASKKEEKIGDPYTLTTCPVSGEKLGSMGEPLVREYDGREVRFCCGGCPEEFEANAEQYWQKIDKQLIEQQKEFYPLETCLVSGEKLGSMGEPVDYVYRNRLVRLCCEGCIKELEAEPAKYMKQLDAAVIEAQGETYPLETCVISGGKLGAMGEPVEKVYANQLVRYCCSGCEKEFLKAPAVHLQKIAAAREGAEAGNDAQGAMEMDEHAGHAH